MGKAKSMRTATNVCSHGSAAGIMAYIVRGAAETPAGKGFEWRGGAEAYSKVCGYCLEAGGSSHSRSRTSA